MTATPTRPSSADELPTRIPALPLRPAALQRRGVVERCVTVSNSTIATLLQRLRSEPFRRHRLAQAEQVQGQHARLQGCTHAVLLAFSFDPGVDCRGEPVAGDHDDSVPVSDDDKNIVNSVLKAAKLIELLSAHQSDMGLAELAGATEMTKSTTRRLLATLEEAGWVTRIGDGRYKMTIRLFEIAAGITDSIDLRSPARHARTPRHVWRTRLPLRPRPGTRGLSGTGRGHPTVPDRVTARRQRHPARHRRRPHRTARLPENELLDRAWREAQALAQRPFDNLGQLTALLAKIRVDGYSFTADDVTTGVAAIGAPIHDLYGNTIAALSIAGQREHLDSEQKPAMVAALLRAAGEVSRRLGHNPTTTHR
ncbi:IclR family transcriptional regulator [Polymorphospora lycopeni]|uniref:Helix-turn-helix domain-containing protein n=1 Tax=Polymorphospora lycopeni TaxID=3140240 RepID=A0ABV5CR82_9ACTN